MGITPSRSTIATSTMDFNCPTGDSIPIEERGEQEVLTAAGPDETGTMRTVRIASPGACARNPAFDVTPSSLVTGFITEKGIMKPDGLPR